AQGGEPLAARGAVSPGPRPAGGATARGGARPPARDLLPDRLRLREALLGDALLLETLPRGLSEVGPLRGGSRVDGGRVPPALHRDLVLAARADPPRLPQPQPDVARRRQPLLDRLPGRAHGAGALRPRLAPPRQLRRARRGVRGRSGRGVPATRRPRRAA